MIADLLFGLYGKGTNYLTTHGVGSRLVNSAVRTAGSVRGAPILGDLIPFTKSSPLELFDYNQMAKGGPRSSYFAGESIDIGADGAYSVVQGGSKVARRRQLAAAAVGGLAAGNLFGVDPMGATSAGNTMAALGGHAFIGSTLYGAGGKTRLLGMGYLGAMGINMLRKGDNMGPM